MLQDNIARVYAAALISAARMKPSDRLKFADLAVDSFLIILNKKLP